MSDRRGDRDEYLSIRCTPEFRSWLDRLCRQERRNRAQMFELGVVRLAAQVGFEEPPPPRMGEEK
jgi:hypothetical protein